MIPFPLPQERDPHSSCTARNKRAIQIQGTVHLHWRVHFSVLSVFKSNLVQLHVGQAGSHVTGVFLWIGHRVAVESQQLLQRKLSSLEGVTEGVKDQWG